MNNYLQLQCEDFALVIDVTVIDAIIELDISQGQPTHIDYQGTQYRLLNLSAYLSGKDNEAIHKGLVMTIKEDEKNILGVSEVGDIKEIPDLDFFPIPRVVSSLLNRLFDKVCIDPMTQQCIYRISSYRQLLLG